MEDKSNDCSKKTSGPQIENTPTPVRKRKYNLKKKTLDIRSKKFSLNSNASRAKKELGLFHSLKKNKMKLPMSVLRDLAGKPFRFNLKKTSNIKSSKAILAHSREAHSKLEANKYDLELKGSILSDDSLDTSQKETFEISNLLPIVSILEKYNFKYEVMPEALVKNSGFFFQDKCMNAFFQCYPEYLCIDILCEVADLEYDLCLFISVDSNGHSEIIAIGLIKSYNSQGLLWLCEVFRKHNPSWRKIQFIMSGKNIDCTETVKKAFPEKLVFISLFHSLKAFKRDLRDLEKVSTHDISEALRIFEHMIHTNTELEYSDLAKQMKQLHPSVVLQFRKIWHPKSDSWALGLLFNSKAILKSLNSFLLFIRNKVRPHVVNQVSITGIIKALQSALMKLRVDRFKKFASVFHSVPTLFCGKSNASIKYSKYLTQYASELVNEQLNLVDDVKNLKRVSPGKYNISGTEILITVNSCSCNFHKLMMLPCSHIFAVRNLLSLPLFVDSLCEMHWTASNYQNTYLELQKLYKSEIPDQSARFEKCFMLSRELFPIVLKSPENISHDRIQLLQNLINVWKNGIKVSVKATTKPNNNHSCDGTDSVDVLCPDYWKDVYGISLKDILDSDNDFSSVSLCSENSDLL